MATSSPIESLRVALDLFETGVDLMRQNLRRRNPEATQEDIDDRLLRSWLLERPGAEYGDSAGRSVDLNTRSAWKRR